MSLMDFTMADLLQEDRYGNYMFVALAMGTLWDHLTTLDEEIEFVWKRTKFSGAQTLFFINRYVGTWTLLHTAFVLVMNSSPSSALEHSTQCRIAEMAQNWAGVAVLWTMQGIMVYRVAAMFNLSKVVIWVQILFFAFEIASKMATKGVAHSQLLPLSCATTVYPEWFGWSWLPSIAFEGLLLFYSLVRGYRYWNTSVKAVPVLLASDHRSVRYVFMRDNIGFPSIAIIVCAINFWSYSRISVQGSHVLSGIAIFTARMLGERLVINLKEAYYRPFQDDISVSYIGSSESKGTLQSLRFSPNTSIGTTITITTDSFVSFK